MQVCFHTITILMVGGFGLICLLFLRDKEGYNAIMTTTTTFATAPLMVFNAMYTICKGPKLD